MPRSALDHLLRLFRPQIEELLQQRDERIRAWQRAHPEVNSYEDRRLEATAQLPVSVEAQVELLPARLGWRGSSCGDAPCGPDGPVQRG